MKIFAIIVLFLVGTSGYTRELIDSTNAEKITKEVIYKDVKNALSQLGEALKVGGEHVYIVLVKQQVTKSVVNLVVIVALSILVIIGYNATRSTFKSHVLDYQIKHGKDGQPNLNYYPDIDDSSKGTASVFLGVITGILFIIVVACILCSTTETVTGFVNPEYGAIKDIFDFIKSK